MSLSGILLLVCCARWSFSYLFVDVVSVWLSVSLLIVCIFVLHLFVSSFSFVSLFVCLSVSVPVCLSLLSCLAILCFSCFSDCCVFVFVCITTIVFLVCCANMSV